ncbi:PP2C family protein-serine/threonine phosphatase [Oceanobacillus massiliensis]|uniref:PP2C family protein-serine/threonine phosphatase n=1 Tax=Oceanobacillus massiliensis TaxID=1465765 RepID=UPI00028995DB|nr:PP2C family protein-serine/threonine phosphatase [Oceanobacillus massiliensis]
MYNRELSIDKLSSAGQMNKTLEREIKMAQNIQMKLLNGPKPKVDNGEVSGVSIPARLIGGDYFDFYLLPNGRLRIVIGDVMGKGIPAAMLMILTRGAFRSASESTKGPGETLTAMNKALYSDLRTLGSFVTVLCAEWDMKTNTFTYASAGHNPPLIIHSEKELKEVPNVNGVMLGGLKDTVYTENTVGVEDNDLVFLYTDGITETKNNDGEMYRIERLEEALLKNFSLEVKEIEQTVVNSIEKFIEGAPQRDDITMVLLKLNKGKADLTSYNSPVLN